MTKTRELAAFTIKTGNIAGNTVALVDVNTTATGNAEYYYVYSNELDFGTITGQINSDILVYEDWGNLND